MKRSVLLLLALLAVSCGGGDDAMPGEVGDACGATRGCADGLTCHDGTCAAPSGPVDGGDGGVPRADATVPRADAANPTPSPDAATPHPDAAVNACTGVICNTPPASTCMGGDVLQVYAPFGTCAPADGTCSYAPSAVTCAAGCSAGACTPSGWHVMTSNTGNTLWGVWGSSASSVWAVGANGTLVYYNGAQWQVRPSPPEALNQYLVAIHGTAANNVFLVAGTYLLRFDGTKWSRVTNLADVPDQGFITGIFATGDAENHVYVSMENFIQGIPHPTLYVVDGAGVVTRLGSATDAQFSACYSTDGSVWAFSATNVLFAGCRMQLWNGNSVGDLSDGVIRGVQRIWAASPADVFTIAYTSSGGGENLSIYDGHNWTTTPVGLNGQIDDLSGTAANRVFLAGWDSVDDVAAVVFYDGVGFTNLDLPPVHVFLNGVWAAPTGEVFVVGSNGTILAGP